MVSDGHAFLSGLRLLDGPWVQLRIDKFHIVLWRHRITELRIAQIDGVAEIAAINDDDDLRALGIGLDQHPRISVIKKLEVPAWRERVALGLEDRGVDARGPIVKLVKFQTVEVGVPFGDFESSQERRTVNGRRNLTNAAADIAPDTLAVNDLGFDESRIFANYADRVVKREFFARSDERVIQERSANLDVRRPALVGTLEV